MHPAEETPQGMDAVPGLVKMGVQAFHAQTRTGSNNHLARFINMLAMRKEVIWIQKVMGSSGEWAETDYTQGFLGYLSY